MYDDLLKNLDESVRQSDLLAAAAIRDLQAKLDNAKNRAAHLQASLNRLIEALEQKP